MHLALLSNCMEAAKGQLFTLDLSGLESELVQLSLNLINGKNPLFDNLDLTLNELAVELNLSNTGSLEMIELGHFPELKIIKLSHDSRLLKGDGIVPYGYLQLDHRLPRFPTYPELADVIIDIDIDTPVHSLISLRAYYCRKLASSGITCLNLTLGEHTYAISDFEIYEKELEALYQYAKKIISQNIPSYWSIGENKQLLRAELGRILREPSLENLMSNLNELCIGHREEKGFTNKIHKILENIKDNAQIDNNSHLKSARKA